MRFNRFKRAEVFAETSPEEVRWPPDQWGPPICGTPARYMIDESAEPEEVPADQYRSFLVGCDPWVRYGHTLASTDPLDGSRRARVWLNLDALIPTHDLGGDLLVFEEQEAMAQAVLKHVVESTYERIGIVRQMLLEYKNKVCGTSEALHDEPPSQLDLTFDGPYHPYRWGRGAWITTPEAINAGSAEENVDTGKGTVFVRNGRVVGGTGTAGLQESDGHGVHHIHRIIVVLTNSLIPPTDWNGDPLDRVFVAQIMETLERHVLEAHEERQSLVRSCWMHMQRRPSSGLVVEQDALYRRLASMVASFAVPLGVGEMDAIAQIARRPYGVDELRLVESELIRRGYRLQPRDDAFNLIRAIARDEGVSLGEAAVDELAGQLAERPNREQVISLLASRGLLRA